MSWFLSRIKNRFFENISFFLYESWVFVSVDAFNEKITTFYNKYRHYPAAKKFIDENLISNKEKTVAFFTKHIFTAGHTSS